MPMTATEAAAMVRRGEVSARELTERVLARIDELNPDVNAVVETSRELALQTAAAADKTTGGPLHGVPITVKDCFNVEGMHTTWGEPAFADYVADSDATIVRRLRDAGAIIVGKTNVHHMLADYGQTANELYGRTNNPWDLSRTPGGSSGGGAAAVATGMTFLDHGSDLVGSIRIPASHCGVYGLRPTSGTVSLQGFQPPGPPALPSDHRHLSTIGPLARSAADLRLALSVIGGAAGKSYSWQMMPSRHTRLGDFRIGVVLDQVSSDVGGALSDAVDALGKAGVQLTEGWPDGVDPVAQAESFGFQVGLFFAFQEGGDFAPLSDVVEQEKLRMAARVRWEKYFEDIDVFLCPTSFTAAFPHDTRPFDERTIATPEGERPYDDQVFWIAQPSLPGLPAVTAPVGFTPGELPVGAQIVGPSHEDDTAITFAELAADVVGGFVAPDGR